MLLNHYFHESFGNLIRGVSTMKQKKENKEIEVHEDFEKAVLAYDSSIVKEYLDMNTFQATLDERDRALYDYTRKVFGETLDTKSQGNPVFGALIERIARTSILLERFESLVFAVGAIDRHEISRYTERGSSYMTLLEQHRKCIEVLNSIRWANDTKKPQKTLARLREMVFEEKDQEKS